MKNTILVLAAIAVGAAPALAAADAGFEAALGGARESALAAASFQAGISAPGRVLSDATTPVEVRLDDKTVKCSAADYSAPMLKVLVPGLAELTALNHRNTREGAPCLAAGRCAEIGPESILKDGAATVTVPVRVILSKQTTLDGQACHVTLVETVSTEIRGVPFFHQRLQKVADRTAADCR